jgi:hypothetical protein
VIIDNNMLTKYHSDWEVVCKGVPERSILGPLLFLFYINDLPFILKDGGNPTLFADWTYSSMVFYTFHIPVLTMYIYYCTATQLTFDQIHILLSVMTVYWIYGL